jgi:N-acetylneuraminic acid mutarotase
MSACKSRAVQIRWNMAAVLVAWLLAAGLTSAEEWKSAAPVPKGAEEVYGIAAGGKLYVFGGLGLDWKAMGMVMEYDPVIDKWTRKRDMPRNLHHVALAEVKGRIYMFGGFTLPEKGKPMWVPVNHTWEYDPQADSWRALAPLPVARGSANAMHVNGRIHVIGGATLPAGLKEEWVHPSRNIAVGTHEIYDLTSNSWTKATDMPTPRNHAAAGAIGDRIYIIGGRIGSVFIPNAFNINLVEEYDPATDQWQLRAPMPTPRSAAAWGVYGGQIYVAGGEVRHRDIWGTYTAVEAFDPKSNSWTRHSPMPMPRHGLAGDFIGNHFHLVSGSVQSGTNAAGLVTNTDRHDVLVIDKK